MKNGKASRAMAYLDDALIESAMDIRDLRGDTPTHLPQRRTRMKKTSWTKWVAVAAAIALVASVGLLLVPILSGVSDTIIALDVNPSLEMEINKQDKITDIRTLNADAEVVIGDMELKGVDLEVAINAIIGSMLKNGYLSAERNSILISVDSTSADKAATLRERLTGEIDALLSGSNIQASVIAQTYEHNNESSQKAEENNISPAKATLISKIVAAELLDANGIPYTYEVLAQLNVHELKLILESKSVTVEGIEASGTANASQYITREQALAIALQKAGLAESDLIRYEIEMDFDDDHIIDGTRGVMVYEVELRTSTMKYEYELLAKDGAILEEEKKETGNKNNESNASGNTGSNGNGNSNGNSNSNEKETFPPATEHISRNDALAIAYADAGVTQSAVKRPEIELDLEKGTYVYEIEFKTADLEYEYTIHATTGEILEREIEPHD